MLAYLLTTEGLEGVGVVPAMELLRDLLGEGLELLLKFRWGRVDRHLALTVVMFGRSNLELLAQ